MTADLAERAAWDPAEHPRDPRDGRWIKHANWNDFTDWSTGRKQSSIGQTADFNAQVQEEHAAGTYWNSGKKQYSWRVFRQRTEWEEQQPGWTSHDTHWTGNLAEGIAESMVKAKSQAMGAMKARRKAHLAQGGDVGYQPSWKEFEAQTRKQRAVSRDQGMAVEELLRWLEAQHPRVPSGKHGGRFTSKPGAGRGRAEGGPWSRAGDLVTYHGNAGIDRGDMPQLSGNVNGEYVPSAVMVPKFIAFLRAQGISVHRRRIDPARLRPTQTTGDMPAIRRIADDLKSGKLEDTKPVTVSLDGGLLDGHHNWAGRLLANQEGGRPGLPKGMRVVQVGLPMPELLAQARRFGQREGIARRKTGEHANPAFASRGLGWAPGELVLRADWDPAEHPRVKHGEHGGEFTRTPGGAAATAGHATFGLVHAESVDTDTVAEFMAPDGTWKPERQALHERIVNQILDSHKPQAHPQAVFLGGGTASGKSTVMARTKQPDSVHVDADEIKGMLPEYQAMVKAGDPKAAAHVHEESSYLAKVVQAEAFARRCNVLIDGTGDSGRGKMERKLAAARQAGASVVGKYVTADTAEAIRRAKARAAQTGRMVPEPVIREIHASVSEVFAGLIEKDAFDAAELWDTNGPKPVLVGEKPAGGEWQVADEAAWRRFLAKTR